MSLAHVCNTITRKIHTQIIPAIVRNNLWEWQELQPTSGPDTLFYAFCDALEVKDGINAPAEGWGLTHALQAWGNFWTKGGFLELRE